MSDSLQLIVYSLDLCPNCELLKDFLRLKGADYIERNMMSAEAMTELRLKGIFVQEAPVLQVGEQCYTTKELFPGNSLDEEFVSGVISGA